MKEYIAAPNGIELKVEVTYNKGGLNPFTDRQERRGFYLSVIPVERKPSECGKYVWEKTTAFSGIKELLVEVKRRSNKAENEAYELAESRKQALIEYVTEKIA